MREIDGWVMLSGNHYPISLLGKYVSYYCSKIMFMHPPPLTTHMLMREALGRCLTCLHPLPFASPYAEPHIIPFPNSSVSQNQAKVSALLLSEVWYSTLSGPTDMGPPTEAREASLQKNHCVSDSSRNSPCSCYSVVVWFWVQVGKVNPKIKPGEKFHSFL